MKTQQRRHARRTFLAVTALLAVTAAGLGGARPAAAAPAAIPTPACADRWTTPVDKAVSDAQHRPVVFVHGWNGDSSGMQKVADNLGRPGSPIAGTFSPALFDYRQHNTEWANSSAVGGCLAAYLAALSTAYRAVHGDGKIEVVAHSMGGLATRFAAAQTVNGVNVGAMLAGLVTFDTPHLGSPFGGRTLGVGAIARMLEYTKHDFPYLFFPGPGTDAGVCLAPHAPPDNRIGDGTCATPPYLPAPARVYEIGGNASVRRSLFGVHLYDVDTSGDGIVPTPSSYGYLTSGPGGPAPVGGHAGHTVVDCTTTLDGITGTNRWVRDLAKAWDQSEGTVLSVVFGTDQAAFNALNSDGPMDPALAAFMLAVERSASCSHSQILTEPAALTAAAQAVHDDDAAARLASKPLTAADLLSAPVPPLCRFPAGTLVNGALPGFPPSQGFPPTVATGAPKVALGDLNGDGVGDAAAVVNCNAGGVGWPDYVVFWSRSATGASPLGAYQMSDAVGDARNGTLKLSYLSGGSVKVDSLDSRPWDCACNPTGRASVTLKWDGTKVVATDVQHLGGPDDASFAGIGAVQLGMNAAQITALGYTSQTGDYYGCVFYSTSADKPQVTYNPVTGRVVQIRPPQGPAGTTAGVGTGSSLSDVRKAYAGKTIENHLDGSFGQGTSGLLVGDGSGGWISFTTDDGATVSAVSVSDHAHMGSVEAGCQ